MQHSASAPDVRPPSRSGSISSPTGSQALKATGATAKLSATAQSSKSLDLSTVEDRSLLPIGVTKVVAARMRMDAQGLSPAMIDLRMNYRNLVNELQVHKGKLVSHQFSLMKPRPRFEPSLPLEKLPCPAGINAKAWFKCLKKRKREKEQDERRERERQERQERLDRLGSKATDFDFDSRVTTNSNSRPTTRGTAHGSRPGTRGNEEDNLPDMKDPTATMEVQEMTEDERVKNVFHSFQEGDSSGLAKAKLGRALEALGYHNPDEKLIKQAIKQMTLFRQECQSELELDEFCVIVLALQKQREAEVSEQFKKLDIDGSGSISVKEFRHLLWDLGYTVTMEAVAEIFSTIDNDNSGEVELPEFEKALQIAHDSHGFMKAEIQELYEIFDRYDADESGEISADELAGALGWFGTPTSIEQARQIIARFDTDDDATLCKAEFLMVMRARLEDEIRESRALFAEADEDHSGAMDPGELVSLFMQLGYTLTKEVVIEGIKEEVGPIAVKTGLVFEDALKVLQAIRRRHGFAKSEVEDLHQVYHKFDTGGDELRDFELARALNWLGYPISADRRRRLWIKVDRDKSNTIDQGEFLMIFRLLREEESEAAKILLERADGSVNLDETALYDMLNRLGYSIDKETIREAMDQVTDVDGDGLPDLLGVMEILKFIRDKQIKRLRESAGLSDGQIQKIRNKFANRVETGNKLIAAAEFEKFMWTDLFKVAKNDEREHQRILTIMNDFTGEESPKLHLKQMFEIVRLYQDELDKEYEAKEDQAVIDTGFSKPEVAQFREIFVNADDNGGGTLSSQELLSVFANFLKLPPKKVNVVKVGIDGLVKKGGKKDEIDFPDFLRLMSLVHNKDDSVL